MNEIEKVVARCTNTGCGHTMELSNYHSAMNFICPACDGDKLVFDHNVELKCVMCNKEKYVSSGQITSARCARCAPSSKIWAFKVSADQTPPPDGDDTPAETNMYIDQLSEENAQLKIDLEQAREALGEAETALNDKTEELKIAIAGLDERDQSIVTLKKEIATLEEQLRDAKKGSKKRKKIKE